MEDAKFPLILASTSPRRRELLARLALPFRVVDSAIVEAIEPDETPGETVIRLARLKTRAVARELEKGLVLGADTLVCLDKEILGKPSHEENAKQMLRVLRGRIHEVMTGIAILDAAGGDSQVGLVRTAVRMSRYSEQAINRYVASGEPMDKAGAYAIQARGASLVHSIDGCYYNVVGLPLCEVVKLLGRFGVAANRQACRLPSGQLCPRVSEERGQADGLTD